jgi:hypothetical protein
MYENEPTEDCHYADYIEQGYSVYAALESCACELCDDDLFVEFGV